MVQVCIHHPLNPEESKKCMGQHTHAKNWVTHIDLPFSKDVSLFEGALRNMAADGVIADHDRGELWEEAKTKFDKKALSQKLFAFPTEPIQISNEVTPDQKDRLNLNDPRIAEINIKYRD